MNDQPEPGVYEAITTGREEIAAARARPDAHPLYTHDVIALHLAIDPQRFHLIAPAGTVAAVQDSFRAAARMLTNAARERYEDGVLPATVLYFEHQIAYRKVDVAQGDVSGWSPEGEITFTSGTRCSDKLLLRVSF